MENKTYKDYGKEYIGASDIASLILVGFSDAGLKLFGLHFGGDGRYQAYIIDDTVFIPSHYKMVAIFNEWMKIYDDEGLVKRFNGKKIAIYRAAEMGCIIQVFS